MDFVKIKGSQGEWLWAKPLGGLLYQCLNNAFATMVPDSKGSRKPLRWGHIIKGRKILRTPKRLGDDSADHILAIEIVDKAGVPE